MNDNFSWSNYGSTPEIGIRRLEDISGRPPDESILLENRGETPIFSASGSVISRENCIVEADISMPTSTKRKAIIDDIIAGLLETTYNVLFSISDQPDQGETLFKTKITFTFSII